MQGSSDNSFIPKRGTAKRKQVSGKRQVFIFTYISYILTFAALLSAAGVYFYAQYIDSQLDAEIQALNAEIGSFSQADMERVTKFDLRLTQAQGRLENSVSIVSVFEALQAATIDTVQIESLKIERELDDKFVIEATVQTDSFDSTIFQRGVFLRNSQVQGVEIAQLQNSIAAEGDSADDSAAASKPVVSFQALLDIPLANVPADPQSYQVEQTNTPSTVFATTSADTAPAEVSTETNPVDSDETADQTAEEIENINKDTL